MKTNARQQKPKPGATTDRVTNFKVELTVPQKLQMITRPQKSTPLEETAALIGSLMAFHAELPPPPQHQLCTPQEPLPNLQEFF